VIEFEFQNKIYDNINSDISKAEKNFVILDHSEYYVDEFKVFKHEILTRLSSVKMSLVGGEATLNGGTKSSVLKYLKTAVNYMD